MTIISEAIVVCHSCAGRGAVQMQFRLPSGRRSKVRPLACPTCEGRGGHVRRDRA